VNREGPNRPAWNRRGVLAGGLYAAGAALLPGCGREVAEQVFDRGAEAPGVDGAADAWQRAAQLAGGIQRPAILPRSFPVTSFGASEGFERGSRAAIQAALDRAAADGGGRVILPPGDWFSDGPLRLRSRVTLHLEDGAHLRFSGNPSSYLPEVLTRWEGTEVWTYSPMIFADELEDVAITGRGRIDGQGEAHFLSWRERQAPDQDALRQMGIDGVPVDERRFGEGHYLRPHFLQFRKCRRVLVEGPTLVDSPFWVTHLLYCDQATVRDVNVVSRHINSDGVDVDSSTNVLIEDCRFDVGDDGIAIKSGRDQDGWRVARPSSDIVIRGCRYLGDTGGAMAIGSEMSGGVQDVFVENYRLEHAHHALYFKSNLDRGGRIERVYIRDIDVGSAKNLLIFTNDYHSYRGGNHPPSFGNVLVEDVRCREAGVGLQIVGHERAPVFDVLVRNVMIEEADLPMEIEHVVGLEIDNLRIGGESYDRLSPTGC